MKLGKQGLNEYNAGSFQKAAQTYEHGYRFAVATGDLGLAMQFLNNVGGADLAIFDYQGAMKVLLEGRKLAEKRQDRASLSTIAINLATVYLQLDNVAAASQIAEQGLSAALKSDPHGFRSQLLITLAKIRREQGRPSEAIGLLHEAIQHATGTRNLIALASAWDFLGEVLLDSGDTSGADGPLQHGLRLRLRLADPDLPISYLKLSRLRLAQGDADSAASLLAKAEALPPSHVGFPVWRVHLLRGEILRAQHKNTEALNWFSKAIQAWVSSHGELPSSDAMRTSLASSHFVHPLFSSLIDTDLASRPTPNVDSLIAAEEYRAIAMRQTLTESPAWRKRLPPQYWQTLQQLRAVQAAQLSRDTSESSRQIARYQLELTEFEVGAGLPPSRTVRNKTFEKVDASVTLRGIQKALGPEETLLSFYSDDSVSGVWAVTDSKVEFHRLPSGKILAASAKQFEQAVRYGYPDRDRLGEELYKQLFHDLSPEAERRQFWLIDAADDLFDIPVAALVIERRDGRPVYLVQRHATERIPSALLFRDNSAQPSQGSFLGIGDGIYNAADPRWRPESPGGSFLGISLPGRRPRAAFELPRLAGSSHEIQSCARIWQGSRPPVLLTGGASSRAGLESGLREHPAVIHMAAHVIAPAGQPKQALIDLGLSPQGQPEVLTYDDIANLEVPGATVVVNGCASANGGARFGAGVMGLTRAWLMAGAQSVVGSRWPIPDDTGDLFQSFYTNWKRNQASTPGKRIAAESLQQAQLSILHSNTWRSDPKYWSAFYVFGKE
ncbi:MAG: CHAT domain-containing protein [Bryobacteraceae bacterium]